MLETVNLRKEYPGTVALDDCSARFEGGVVHALIGKNGAVLKKAGTLARGELEDLLEMKVFLECYVKTKNRWRDDISLLQEFGYDQ